MTTWCAEGKRMLALPGPSLDDGRDFRPPGLPVRGPFSALFSEVPSRCIHLVQLRRMLGTPSFFLVLFYGTRCHRRLLVRRLTGGLCHWSFWRTSSWGPVPDLEVRRSREDGGKGVLPLPPDFLCSRLNAPRSALRFLRRPLGCSGLLYWMSLVWSGMASVLEGSQGCQVAFSRGPRRRTWMKPAWTLQKWGKRVTTPSVNRSPLRPGFDPGYPGLWWAFHVLMADFLRVSRLSAKDHPVSGCNREGGAFSPGLSGACQHASC
ncbi:hypothetical protein GWK47_022610 [Chionoecetes opilio]|uniref:Uncharacterized protein n=1 Tax=Chionoecetes opilio TaxID=41210 RepID=A0A8J5CDN0_CHIOP|nr:hypothetical protein GWK47_022610 [Chionoecetes opilio]